MTQPSRSSYERGELVRPAPWVIKDIHHQFIGTPRPVRKRTSRDTTCCYCHAAVLRGDLYAAGLEPSRPLCLGCVERAEL